MKKARPSPTKGVHRLAQSLKSTSTWTTISALLLLCSAAMSYRSGMLSHRLHDEAWDIAAIACAFAAALISQLTHDDGDDTQIF